MCKVIDDILPVVGAVVGSFILPGVGTAIGAGLGGFTGNYVQTHNFGSALGAGAISGAASFAGNGIGALAGGLGDAAGSGVGGFTGEAGAEGASTLGGLEGASGGAAMFGPAAGTGTAIGSQTAGALGGNGLGLAGGDALSGISANPTYLGALGGGTQGTGLGMGTQGQATPDLAGAVANNGVSGAPTAAATPQAINSPVSSLSNTPAGGGVTTGPGLGGGAQVAPTGSGVPSMGDAGTGMEGTQAVAAPGGEQGALSSMYGPNSTAAGSPMGQGIANTQIEVPGQGVQFGALGEGTNGAPGMVGAQGAGKVGDNDFLSTLFGGGQQQPGQLPPWLGLAKAGLGAYQQYAQQSANDRYTHSIDSMFAPDSPYAQQMQQTLGRQDAAAGRNTQYGTRAVQLAAALAQAHANALGNSNYARTATATPGASMLNSLFGTFANPQYAQGFGQLGTSAFNGLSSLFGG